MHSTPKMSSYLVKYTLRLCVYMLIYCSRMVCTLTCREEWYWRACFHLLRTLLQLGAQFIPTRRCETSSVTIWTCWWWWGHFLFSIKYSPMINPNQNHSLTNRPPNVIRLLIHRFTDSQLHRFLAKCLKSAKTLMFCIQMQVCIRQI